MKGDARHTLVLPFEKGYLELPDGKSKGVFLNARSLPAGAIEWTKKLSCQQGGRAEFMALQGNGFQVDPAIECGDFAFALVLCGKHKRLNEANIARAASLTDKGCMIVVAGDKTAGIASLKKHAGKFAEIEGSLSKHHAVVFWFSNPGSFPEPAAHKSPAGYDTAPGMFSPGKIDAGSELLGCLFDKRIGGNVADFGTGWGYLSSEVLNRAGTIHHLDLYEADHASLEAAKFNLSNTDEKTKFAFFWHDLVNEPVTRKYDWIIMNPPFHTGRAAQPAIGQTFIKTARGALRKGGKLMLVANRSLPYEAVLTQEFSSHRLLGEGKGFKVLEAVC